MALSHKLKFNTRGRPNIPLYSSIVQNSEKEYACVNDVESLFYLLANLDSDHLQWGLEEKEDPRLKDFEV